MKAGIKIHDIEVYPNLFLYGDIDRDTEEENIFLLWKDKNDISAFVKYMKLKHKLVGYNSLNYDGPIIQYIIDNSYKYSSMSNNDIMKDIYAFSQRTIADTHLGGRPPIPERKLINSHLDLLAMWHFNNRSRRTRLKDLQVAMDWYRVKDGPIHFDKPINTWEEVLIVIDYWRNDARSTFEFFKRSRKQIDLRQSLSKTFNLNLISADEPKIGSEIFAKLLSESMSISVWDLKQMRTHRPSINLGEILLPYIEFQNPILKGLLNVVKNTTITKTKGAFKQKIKVNGFTFDMGLGGIHGCIKPGVYKGKKILDIDVVSFYPNLAINNNLYPEHLGIHFCEIFKMIFNERLKIPKSNPINHAYKIILNGVYGKSREETSYFYDPKFTMQITVNGQLLILMLAERLMQLGVTLLQANTDGITIMYDDNQLDEKVNDICNEWCQITNLKLEFASYKSMIIKDVSSYMAVYENGDVKYKGAFGPFENKNPNFINWHADPSFRIVQHAISKYFIDGTPIERTVNECKDIFMFTGRAKFQSDSNGETRCIDENFNIIKEEQQKTTRYIVTNKGCQFYKVYADKEEVIHKGFLVTIYNDHIEKPFEKYDINPRFYIEEANKIIQIIEGDKNQLSLF